MPFIPLTPPRFGTACHRASDSPFCEAQRTANLGLLERTAQGDLDAFSSLYDQFAGPMFSLILRISGSQSESEDILQVGFIQVWEQAGRYRAARGSPFGWVATIMRRKAIDALRLRQCHRRYTLSAAEEPMIGNGPGPDAFVLLREKRALVQAALQWLREDERHALQLAFFKGLNHRQIADSLEMPMGTIKARIRRALFKLRERLRSEGYTEFDSEVALRA